MAGPAVVAGLLPSPAALMDQVREGSDAVAVLGAAMLLAVSVLVWALLAWAAVVLGAAALTGLPGCGGRLARAVLRVSAPEVARRVLLVATGVSLVTGAAACAAPGTPHGDVAASPTLVATTAATSPAPASASATGPAYRDGGYVGPVGTGAGAGGSGGPAATGGVDVAGQVTTAATPEGGRPLLDLDWPTPSAGAPVTTTARPTSLSVTPQSETTHAAPSGSTPSGSTPSGSAPSSAVVAATSATTAPATASPAGSGNPTTVAPGSADTATPHPTAHPDDTTPPTNASDAASVHPATTSAPSAPARRPRLVTVRPGDSLWSIAARHLPADAPVAQIDAAWRRWYAANRSVIGPDPNLILPGQHLRPPNAERTSS